MCNMILQKCIDQSGPLPANRSRHHPNSMFVYGVTFTADVVSTPTITQTPKVTEGLVHSQWWSTPAKTHWSWKRPLLPLYLLPSLCPHPPAGSLSSNRRNETESQNHPVLLQSRFHGKGSSPEEESRIRELQYAQRVGLGDSGEDETHKGGRRTRCTFLPPISCCVTSASRNQTLFLGGSWACIAVISQGGSVMEARVPEPEKSTGCCCATVDGQWTDRRWKADG